MRHGRISSATDFCAGFVSRTLLDLPWGKSAQAWGCTPVHPTGIPCVWARHMAGPFAAAERPAPGQGWWCPRSGQTHLASPRARALSRSHTFALQWQSTAQANWSAPTVDVTQLPPCEETCYFHVPLVLLLLKYFCANGRGAPAVPELC